MTMRKSFVMYHPDDLKAMIRQDWPKDLSSFIATHTAAKCDPTIPCPIHRRSNHPLRSAPLVYDATMRMRVSRVCEHGKLHVDPDGLHYHRKLSSLSLLDPARNFVSSSQIRNANVILDPAINQCEGGVHHSFMCDGCCKPKVAPKPKVAKVVKPKVGPNGKRVASPEYVKKFVAKHDDTLSKLAGW